MTLFFTSLPAFRISSIIRWVNYLNSCRSHQSTLINIDPPYGSDTLTAHCKLGGTFSLIKTLAHSDIIWDQNSMPTLLIYDLPKSLFERMSGQIFIFEQKEKDTIHKLCCLSALFQIPVQIMIDKQNIWKWTELTKRENPLKSGRQCNWLFLVKLYNMSYPKMLHDYYPWYLFNQQKFLDSFKLKVPFY